LSKSCSDPKDENTIDFYLSATRNTATAKRFLGKSAARPEEFGEAEDHQHRPTFRRPTSPPSSS